MPNTEPDSREPFGKSLLAVLWAGPLVFILVVCVHVGASTYVKVALSKQLSRCEGQPTMTVMHIAEQTIECIYAPIGANISTMPAPPATKKSNGK